MNPFLFPVGDATMLKNISAAKIGFRDIENGVKVITNPKLAGNYTEIWLVAEIKNNFLSAEEQEAFVRKLFGTLQKILDISHPRQKGLKNELPISIYIKIPKPKGILWWRSCFDSKRIKSYILTKAYASRLAKNYATYFENVNFVTTDWVTPPNHVLKITHYSNLR